MVRKRETQMLFLGEKNANFGVKWQEIIFGPIYTLVSSAQYVIYTVCPTIQKVTLFCRKTVAV